MERNERVMMKIKLHNSMAKHQGPDFIFNNHIFLVYLSKKIYVKYSIDNDYNFLIFLEDKKDFIPGYGFGIINCRKYKDWWTNCKWREL